MYVCMYKNDKKCYSEWPMKFFFEGSGVSYLRKADHKLPNRPTDSVYILVVVTKNYFRHTTRPNF